MPDGFVCDEGIAGFRGRVFECRVGEVEGVEVVVVEEANDLLYISAKPREHILLALGNSCC